MYSYRVDQAIRGESQAVEPGFKLAPDVDRSILLLYLTLILIGLIMVSSASISIADQQTGDPFYYAKRQFLRILLSLVLVTGQLKHVQINRRLQQIQRRGSNIATHTGTLPVAFDHIAE